MAGNELLDMEPAEKEYFDSKGEKEFVSPDAVEHAAADEPEEQATDPLDEPLDKEETKAESKKVKTVPHQALHAERENRKRVEAELSKAREERAKLEGRFEALIARLQQPEQQHQEPQSPDPEKDPIGALKWQQEQFQRFEEERQQQKREAQQREQIETQTRQLDGAYKAGWDAFSKEHPDALKAYSHFVENLAEYFSSLGVSDPENRNQLIAQEERKLAYKSMQQGKNPAEVIYALAQRQGYRSEPEKPAVDAAAKEIERKSAAIAASKSLSSAGGSGRDGLPSVREIASMNDDEYDEFVDKLTPAQRRKLLGD